jgi:hypothetical protein
MVNNPSDVENIYRTVSDSYKIAVALDILLGSSIREKALAQQESRAPRRRIESLIQEMSLTSSNVTQLCAESSPLENNQFNLGANSEPTTNQLLAILIELEEIRKPIAAAASNPLSGFNSDLAAMLATLQSSAEAVGSLAAGNLIELPSDERKVQALQQHASDLSHELARFGAIAGFARLVIRDSLNAATFNESMPESYEGAWNLLREKEGHQQRFNESADVPPQVTGSSPKASQHVVLCGSNMSGKSFFLQRDMMLRLSAQSFGFAPAALAMA